MKARLAFFNRASHDLASYSFDIFLKCIHMESCAAWLGMILPEQMQQVDQLSLTSLAMIRLHILLFLVLTLQWKISETIPPIVTVIQ